MEPSRDCKGEGPEPGGLAPLEGHSDLFFVGFAQLWDPFLLSFFSLAYLMTSHF